MLALSATYPESLAQHLTRYMREPTFVRLNPKDMGLKGEFDILSGKSHDIYLKHNVLIFKSCPSKRLNTGFVPEMIFFPHSCCLLSPPPGLKQYYKLVHSHSLPHKVFEEKVQHLLELFSKIPFNQALVFSNLHTR